MSRKILELFIDTSRPATDSLVYGLNSGNTKDMDPVVFGDTLDLALRFINGGVVDSDVANPNVSVTVSIGYGGESNLCYSENFVLSSSYGYTGSLGINSTPLSQSFSPGDDYLSPYPKIFVTAYDSTTQELRTYYTDKIQIFNSTATGSVLPAASYYNTTQSLATFVTYDVLAASTASVQAGHGAVKESPNIIHAVTSASYQPTGSLIFAKSATQLSMSNAAYLANLTDMHFSMSRFELTGSLYGTSNISASKAYFSEITASTIKAVNSLSASYATSAGRADSLRGNVWYTDTGSAMVQRSVNEIQYGIHTTTSTSSFYEIVNIYGNTSNTASAANAKLKFGNKQNTTDSGIGFRHYKNGNSEYALNIGVEPTGSTNGRITFETPVSFNTPITASRLVCDSFEGGANVFNKLSVGRDQNGYTLLSLGSGSAAVAPLSLTPQPTDCNPSYTPQGSLFYNSNAGDFRVIVGLDSGSLAILPTTLFKQTNTVSITGATAGDQDLASGTGALTIWGGTLSRYSTIKFEFIGYSAMASTGRTVNFKFKIGGTTFVTSTAVDGIDATNIRVKFEGEIGLRTVSATGTVRCQGLLTQYSSNIPTVTAHVGTSDVSLDTTADNLMQVTCDISGGGGSDTVTITNGYIQLI